MRASHHTRTPQRSPSARRARQAPTHRDARAFSPQRHSARGRRCREAPTLEPVRRLTDPSWVAAVPPTRVSRKPAESSNHQTRHIVAQVCRDDTAEVTASPHTRRCRTQRDPHPKRGRLLPAASSLVSNPSPGSARALWPTVEESSTCTRQSRGRSRAGSLRGLSRVTARLHPHCRESHAAGSAARRVTTDFTRTQARNRPLRLVHVRKGAVHSTRLTLPAPLRRLVRCRARSAVHDGASECNPSGSSAAFRRFRCRSRRPLGGEALATTSAAASAVTAPPRCSHRPVGRHRRLEFGAGGNPACRSRRRHRPQRYLLRRQRPRRQPPHALLRDCQSSASVRWCHGWSTATTGPHGMI